MTLEREQKAIDDFMMLIEATVTRSKHYDIRKRADQFSDMIEEIEAATDTLRTMLVRAGHARHVLEIGDEA